MKQVYLLIQVGPEGRNVLAVYQEERHAKDVSNLYNANAKNNRSPYEYRSEAFDVTTPRNNAVDIDIKYEEREGEFKLNHNMRCLAYPSSVYRKIMGDEG